MTGQKPKKKKGRKMPISRGLGGRGAPRAMRRGAGKGAPTPAVPASTLRGGGGSDAPKPVGRRGRFTTGYGIGGGQQVQSPARAGGRRRRPRKRRPRKRYGYGGSSHMDRGLSYGDTHQGYRSDAGKPDMGHYGPPRQGYIDQSGMPNASKMKRMMDYMSNYYGGGNGGNSAGNPNYHAGTSSSNAGTSPSPGSMDSTYMAGQATIPKNEKQRSGR